MTALVQHVLVVLARISLFVFCRKFLLDALYKDLRSLSAPDAGPLDADQDDTELDTLPTASTSRAPELRHHNTPGSASSLSFVHSVLFNRASTLSKDNFESNLSRSAFALCFEESCILFLLVMCQALDVLSPRVRKLHWTLSIFVLVSLVIIFIPLLQCHLFTYRTTIKRTLKSHLAFTLTPYLFYLFAFSYVPLPKQQLGSYHLFNNAVARMTVLGTLLLGLLSGFGAVSTAWSFRPSVSASEEVTDKDINSAAAALERVRTDLSQRQREAQESGAVQESPSWLPTRLFKGPSGASALLQEIEGLRALESQMARNLDALQRRRGEIAFRRTLKGRIFVIIGQAFAVYCVFRIISSVRNLIFGPSTEPGLSSPDILTHLLARIVSFLPLPHSIELTPHAIASLARQISLLLVGCIILSSVRAVLRQIARVLRVSSHSLGAAFLLLFLAQLMGTYLLSTLIQLRTSFPPSPLHSGPGVVPPPANTTATPPNTELDAPLDVNGPGAFEGSGEEDNLFASLPEYQLFGVLFDASFLLAAIFTSGVVWAHKRLNRAEVFT